MAIKERLKAFRSLRGGKSEDVQDQNDTDDLPIEAFSNHVSGLKDFNLCAFSVQLPKRATDDEQVWTSEAEDAYKLLVECGRRMGETEPTSAGRSATVDMMKRASQSPADKAGAPTNHDAPPLLIQRTGSARFRMAGKEMRKNVTFKVFPF